MLIFVSIIPNIDEHGSESVAACDLRREYICGFTGPIGTAIVTTDAAYLLAPSRYHAQALTQLDENWTFIPSTDWMAFLATIATEEVRVGIDGRLISHTDAAKLTKAIPSKVVYPVTNLVDAYWRDRPPAPLDPLFLQSPLYSGEEASSKLDRIRGFLQTRPPDRPSYAKGTPGPHNYVIAILLTRMDEVAWTLNLRGSDTPFMPLFRAYFFLSASLAVLFIHPEKLQPDVLAHLAALSVSVRPYADIWKFLRKREWEIEGKVIIAPDASYSVALVLSGYRTAVMPSPVRDMMALKNPVELEGLRRAYLRDGVAVVQFFAWLEEKLVHKGYEITEWEAAQRLLEFRKAYGAVFMGLTGLTRAQAGVNASEEGYVPRKTTARRVDRDTPFVLCVPPSNGIGCVLIFLGHLADSIAMAQHGQHAPSIWATRAPSILMHIHGFFKVIWRLMRRCSLLGRVRRSWTSLREARFGKAGWIMECVNALHNTHGTDVFAAPDGNRHRLVPHDV